MDTDIAALGERYEILERLGLKGVSLVYRGYDRAEDREVVIKRVAPNFEDRAKYTEKDLVEDAIALSSLRNPNFLTVYDYGKDENGPFVVTEALQGVILEGTLQKCALSLEDFVRLAKQTLESLIAAHEAGLTGVHLDPWNIMLLRQAGGRFRLKILGLGRSAANALPILETEYALERGMRHANPWAEFLSLGRLYYQALTGFRPFGNAESLLVQGSPAMTKLVSCHGRRPDVPAELCDWVMWLIAGADKEPGLTAEQVLGRFLTICAEFEEAPSGPLGEDAASAAAAVDRLAGVPLKSHALDEAHAVYAEYAEKLLRAQADARAEAESKPQFDVVEPVVPVAIPAPLKHLASLARPLQPQPQAHPQPPPQAQPLPQPQAQPEPQTLPPPQAQPLSPPQAQQVTLPQVPLAWPAPLAPTFQTPPTAEAMQAERAGVAPNAEPEPVEPIAGVEVTGDSPAGTPKVSGKSSRRKQRRRAAAKKKNAAETATETPAESKGASDFEPRSIPPRARSVRAGEVPLAGMGGFRKIESQGVFLPAPENAIVTEDLKRGVRREPAVETWEAATNPRPEETPSLTESAPGKVTESNLLPEGKGAAGIPGIELLEIDFLESGLPEFVSGSANPGLLEAPEPIVKTIPGSATESAWPKAPLSVGPLRADAAELAPAGAGSRSWRVQAIALAVLLSASFVILVGSLVKSSLRRNGDGNSTAASPALAAYPTAGARAVSGSPAVTPVAHAFLEASAGGVDAELGEVLSDARAAQASGDDLTAISHYLTAMRTHPDNAEVKSAMTSYIESLAERPPDVVGFLDRALVECAEEHGIGNAMRLLGERAMAVENWNDAYRWLGKAAVEQDVPGTRLLGLLLATGQGAPRNVEAAAECFEWAANKGDLSASYLAGECYVLGKGVEKDPARGFAFLERAATAGDLRAVDLMGVCHAHGLGTEKNYEKALACFREAVEGGYPAALANLGVLYIQGQGVKQDAKAAVDYFREGAEANNATCMYYYGKCLEEGFGVEESRVLAIEWYGKAAAAGNEEARGWFAARGEVIPK